MNVVQRGEIEFQVRAAVHAAAAAVSHRGELERSLVLRGQQPPHPTKETSRGAGCAGEGDAMTVSSGQSHLAGKDDTPRRERLPRAGCRASWSASHRGRQHVRRAACARIVRWVQPCTISLRIGLRVRRVSGRAARRPISAVGVPIAQEAERAAWTVLAQWLRARRSSLVPLRSGRSATGSRNVAMMRAAFASSTVRSGICDAAKGSGTSKPSSGLRGMT